MACHTVQLRRVVSKPSILEFGLGISINTKPNLKLGDHCTEEYIGVFLEYSRQQVH